MPPLMDGGGNMEWMLWRLARDRCSSWLGSLHCASWMKSSMYTSSKCRNPWVSVLVGDVVVRVVFKGMCR